MVGSVSLLAADEHIEGLLDDRGTVPIWYGEHGSHVPWSPWDAALCPGRSFGLPPHPHHCVTLFHEEAVPCVVKIGGIVRASPIRHVIQ